MNDRERFAASVDRNGPVPAHRPELGPCHVWTGGFTGKGYGTFWLNGKSEHAHRVAFFFAHGSWPEPFGCHHCDNRACVNDAHLFEGTNDDNVADKMGKGRHVVAHGERHGRAKLTEQDVRDIRANYALCRVTQKELGRRFGVSQGQIHKIVRDKQRRA